MQTAQKTITHDEVNDPCNTIHWYIAGLVKCNTIGQCENLGSVDDLSIKRSWALTLTSAQTKLLAEHIQRTVKQFNVAISTYKCTSGLVPFKATRLTFTKK